MAKWNETLDVSDVFHNDTLSVADKAKTIAARLRNLQQVDSGLLAVVDRLESQTDADEFDEVWDVVYDWADSSRVWIRTF